MAHTHWQTLDGRWTYTLHKNSTLRIVNITHNPSSSSSTGSGSTSSPLSGLSGGMDSRQEQKAVCHSVLDHLGSNNRTYRVVAHLSQGWYVVRLLLMHTELALASCLNWWHRFELIVRGDIMFHFRDPGNSARGMEICGRSGQF